MTEERIFPNRNELSELDEAIIRATELHAGQLYGKPPGKTEPYIFHTLRVMLRVQPGPEQVVAVLHDVIEDTWYTVAHAHRDWPPQIADALDAISHRKDEDYWVYIDRCKANELARAVKLADLFENLSRLSNLPAERAQELQAKYTKAIRLLTT